MPTLDVSEIIADPEFSDDIVVIRSSRTVGANGRVIDTPGTYYTFGCVQPAPEIRLMQIPEAERVGSFISVVTPFRLFALTDTTAPDQVQWNSQVYRVKLVRDWSTYGNGFVEGICELIGLTSGSPF